MLNRVRASNFPFLKSFFAKAWVMMIQLGARQGTTCSSDSQWYVCSRGPFQGCCWVDPCTTGICPDQSSSELSSTTEGDSETTTTSSTTQREDVTFTPNATTSISSSGIASETMSPQSTSTPVHDPEPSNQSNRAVIGGIAGGVAALVIIIAIITYLVYRPKKKRKRFTLLHWRVGSCSEDAIRVIEADGITSAAKTGSYLSGAAMLNTRNAQSRKIPPSPSLGISARIDSPQTLPPTTFPMKTEPIMGSSSKGAIYPTLSIPRYPSDVHPAFRQRSAMTPTPDSTTSLINNCSASNHSPYETTPELFDTGFYRGRAELSSTPSRELINVPYDDQLSERKQRSLWRSEGLLTPVVTRDGAILTANFNGVLAGPSCHAMSFMQLVSPSDSSPLTYQFNWRSRERKEKEKEKENNKQGMRWGVANNCFRPA
ncbi:hypothetical protein BJX63DRAFT_187315 [Aspergillus granulosus]|uniref:Uncharacterized protein n=1 Tax=Aspergillus granulosus TaxID=176169 RepID=A0ABR4HHM9_9EURO